MGEGALGPRVLGGSGARVGCFAPHLLHSFRRAQFQFWQPVHCESTAVPQQRTHRVVTRVTYEPGEVTRRKDCGQRVGRVVMHLPVARARIHVRRRWPAYYGEAAVG